MLNHVRKYLKIKAEARKLMQKGDLEGYLDRLREMYEIRSVLSDYQPST